jgi:hypothetical protein
VEIEAGIGVARVKIFVCVRENRVGISGGRNLSHIGTCLDSLPTVEGRKSEVAYCATAANSKQSPHCDAKYLHRKFMCSFVASRRYMTGLPINCRKSRLNVSYSCL